MIPPQPPSSDRRRSRARLWLFGAIVVLASLVAVSQLGDNDDAGGGPAGGGRTGAYLLEPADLAGASGTQSGPDDFVRTSPPVDLDLVERSARSLSMGQATMPESRAITTYRERATGFETTQVVLVYADPTKARSVQDMAETLLPRTFGLQPETLAMDGVDDARVWSAGGYSAVSFRRGGVVVFVGTTDTRDPEVIQRLGNAAKLKLEAAIAAAAGTEAATVSGNVPGGSGAPVPTPTAPPPPRSPA